MAAEGHISEMMSGNGAGIERTYRGSRTVLQRLIKLPAGSQAGIKWQ